MAFLTRRAALTVGLAATWSFGARSQTRNGPGPIRIGVLTDMSGPFRDSTGPTSVACARQAVEDFGDKGYAVEVLAADHQNKPDVGAGIARQWFDSGVDMILDVPNSSVALAVNTIAKDRNKTYINCGGASSDLTGKDCTATTIHWGYDTFMLAAAVGSVVTRAGGTKWFFISTNQGGGPVFARDATGIVEKNGGTVVGTVQYPFPSTSDFSAYLLRAQSSGANVVGLANAGDDTVNCIKQAHEFGLTASGIQLAVGFGSITIVHGVGLEAAQDLVMTESFYWDLNDRTRAFAKRVQSKTPRTMPSAIHAACYAGTLHFLRTIDDLGLASKADGAAVVARMKAVPAQDDCFGTTVIRGDGRAMVTPYVLQTKTPAESSGEWDVFKVLSSMPAADAALPITACPLARPI